MANYYKNNTDIENIAFPPHVVLKLLLVESHDGIINALGDYYNKISRANVPGVEFIKSRLIEYFFRAKASLQANEGKKLKPRKGFSVEEIQETLFKTEDINVLISIFDYINNFLYNKGVLKFETGIRYDETDAEKSNQIRGFG